MEKSVIKINFKDLFNLLYSNECLGIAIFFSFVSFYYKMDYNPILEEDLIFVEGILEKELTFGSTPGDVPAKYMRLKLKNIETGFCTTTCSYVSLDKVKAKGLRPGDNLKVGIKVILTMREKKQKMKDIVLYSLKTSKGDVLISLASVNSCKNDSWKMLFVFIIPLLLLAINTFIKDLRNLRNKKKIDSDDDLFNF